MCATNLSYSITYHLHNILCQKGGERWRFFLLLWLPTFTNIMCIRNSRMHYKNKHAILESSVKWYTLVEIVTFLVAPPCCFRRPSFTLASFSLTIFMSGPLCCVIFVLGFLCSPVAPLLFVGLIWALVAIWSFSSSVMRAFFCGLLETPLVQMLNHFFLPSSFPLLGVFSSFP